MVGPTGQLPRPRCSGKQRCPGKGSGPSIACTSRSIYEGEVKGHALEPQRGGVGGAGAEEWESRLERRWGTSAIPTP